MIQTVTGPLEASELGTTMAHEHLAVDLSGVRGDEDSVFGYSDLLVSELRGLKEAGADSVIEVSCIGMGRDVNALHRLSSETGLHIVCSTGFYLESFHPSWLKEMSFEEVADLFVDEFVNGIGETGIKPGVIGEVAGEKTEITAEEHKVMVASALAAQRVGCAVTTHCQLGLMAVEQARIFSNWGMSPDKIVLGHLDLADDLDYYKRVLDLGVNIGFDTCGKESYMSDERRASNLARLVELGYVHQIVLSADISRKSYMSPMGGQGYTCVLKRMIPMLRDMGVSEEAVTMMLVNNPARIFDIEDGA